MMRCATTGGCLWSRAGSCWDSPLGCFFCSAHLRWPAGRATEARAGREGLQARRVIDLHHIIDALDCQCAAADGVYVN
jgi:hypothetical protein